MKKHDDELKIIKKDLDKLLKNVLPKQEKSHTLFWIFAAITTIAFAWIFITSFFIKDEKWINVCLSISSGIFASGLFATSVEGMIIRNKRAIIRMKLSSLRFGCSNLIDFIYTGFNDDEEPKNYQKWVEKIISNRNNMMARDNLFMRLQDIIESCNDFSAKNFDYFDNPFINFSILSEIRSLGFKCRMTQKLIDDSNESVSVILRIHLTQIIPDAIQNIFKNFKSEFTKEIQPSVD